MVELSWFGYQEQFNVNATTFNLLVYSFDVLPVGYGVEKKCNDTHFRENSISTQPVICQIDKGGSKLFISTSIAGDWVCRKTCLFLFQQFSNMKFQLFEKLTFYHQDLRPLNFKSYLTTCSGTDL